MKVSPEIQTLVPYVPGKPISETQRELGLDKIVKLASNESPWPPSPKVVEAIQKAASEINRYPDSTAYEMREAVSKYYKVPTNWLGFCSGSDEIADILIRIFCEPGDQILTSQAAFSCYQISAQAARVQTIFTSLGEGLRFDLKAMLKDLKSHPKIRIVFLPNPNNPTGTYFTNVEFEEFMSEAGKLKDVLIVIDEAYVEFVRAKDYPNGKDYLEKYLNLALMRTTSKVFGLAGVRMGALLARPEIIDLINRVRKPFNINSLAQVAVIAALNDPGYVDRLKKLVWSGLDYYYKELDRLGLKYYKGEGNFVLIDTKRDGDEVFKAILKHGVIVRPVKPYGLNTHIRLSVGLQEENEAAVSALEKVLR
jgi:histidinol-phosphate aminotransferase